MARKTKKKQIKDNGAALALEAQLWKAADLLRGHMDAVAYNHVVLGLIFLKYVSDAFEEHRSRLSEVDGADPEDRDEYLAESIFWVPQESRWSHLLANAKQPTIGKLIDNAMGAVERENVSLKGVLPKNYARPDLRNVALGEDEPGDSRH